MSNPKAEGLIAEGQKALKKFFGSKKDKAYDASDKFCHAARLYKIDRNFEKAGECFLMAADALHNVGDDNSASSHYIDSTLMFFKVQAMTAKAHEALDKAVDILCTLDSPAKSAQLIVKSCELLEKEQAYDLAIQAYNKALGLLTDMPDVSALQASIHEKKAYLFCEKRNYNEAAKSFTEAATLRNQIPLTQTSAQSTFVVAELCRLAAGDLQGAIKEYDNIVYQCPSIKVNFEGRYFNAIMDAAQNTPEKLPEAIKAYKDTHENAKWMVDILNLIQNPDEREML
ncbi:hypothetical protein TVAG_403340 [Trichomonas vaginalis G3]|uniref:Gamma-soluble NSF attachment protein n=1 Tax=Trichomonas vaginalis (strain ATCC PRA-98 / G3) TaxID=412133 RepID=A2F8X0_TRIV3|nr:SNARE complex disassembly protein family [Trichomonas vaginalis G3]EAX98652.1 hypothetical protein TVAG_403340 [Trichomonas vaginalis G3]KAI5508434.1 SNARE complex disassembly protein family [Trichomonas vaginalis G3]|eukprot:XP_001311582.1 hypothetical protein [Trichomonas vaginalis G3]